jgi:hypothetical protein
MDNTKFFTEQVTSCSRGEASDEDMQRRITDFGADKMPDDSTYFMPEGGGGFVGRGSSSEPNGQEPGFYEVQDEPLRLPALAMSSDFAGGRVAPTSPIDRIPPLDHTSS